MCPNYKLSLVSCVTGKPFFTCLFTIVTLSHKFCLKGDSELVIAGAFRKPLGYSSNTERPVATEANIQTQPNIPPTNSSQKSFVFVSIRNVSVT